MEKRSDSPILSNPRKSVDQTVSRAIASDSSISQPLPVVNTLGEISCCPCKNKPPSNGRTVQRKLPSHISVAYTDSIADFLSDVKGKV